ncbi:hemagglutinin repeat-containing protein [Luteibacter flocculans]|uniref:Hemagglutinin repeat-containing protein n=1 Tax=Luteibacter flocculans TaxID=2780091 RepID=A0ABY4T3K2_9GAMM|nr:hemagglutinin repeat-containing protein [Luteibacter flocculans]URL59486.1 hemagglutinin repeat-containing protein [Luteibacter flocculans]
MTIKATMGHRYGAVAISTVRSLALAVALATLGIPVVSWAQQVPDAAAGAHRPTMDSAANGVPVVDIVAPNAEGVSHNKYQRFDVDQRGVILNNSANIVRTQLGGYVAGNDNLKGGEASLILNEVTSALPSSLRGYIEVGGKAAPVVIANPYGITCDGCGVINSQRFTLTTGTPVFGGSGSLDAFHVTGGSIAIGSGGLDGSVADRTDLIARAVQLNGQLWAKDLSVVAGSNDVNYADAGVRVNATDAAHPAVAIDVAALGGMYAEKIRLVGTEAGVGVVSSGAIAAQAGDLTLSNAGEVRLGGTTVALGNASLDASGPVTVDGTFGTQNGAASLTSGSTLTVPGRVIAGGSLTVNAAGDVVSSGRFSAGGNLAVYAAGAVRNAGLIYSDQAFDLRANALHNEGTIYGLGGGSILANGLFDATAASTLHAGGALAIDAGGVATNGIVDAGGALTLSSRSDANLAGAVQGAGSVAVRATNQLNNGATIVSGGRLDLQAARVSNLASGIVSSGSDLVVNAAGDAFNQGTLYAAGGVVVNAASLTQAAAAQLHGVASAQVTLAGNLVNSGTLVGGGGLAVNARSIASDGELGTQQGDAALVSGSDITLTGTTVVDGSLSLRAPGTVTQQGQLTTANLDAEVGSLANNGETYARGDARLHASHDLSNTGSLYADGQLTLGADGTLTNSGTLHAGTELALHAASIDSSKQIDATRDVTLDAQTMRLAGNVQGGRDVALTVAGGVDNAAAVVAGRDVTVQAGSLTNSGAISATHDLALDVQGDVDNAGQLYAGHGLDISAHALTVGTAGAVSAVDTATLTLQDALRNAGSVVGVQSLAVDAQSIDSTGSVGSSMGSAALTTRGDLHLGGVASAASAFSAHAAGNVLLDGTLTGTSLDLAAQSMTLAGAIHATGDAVLDAAQSIALGGDAYADGALTVHAASIDQSGTTHAGGDLALKAASIVTHGTLDAGNDLLLTVDAASLAGRLQAARDVHVQASGTMTQAATVVAARDVTLGTAHFDGAKEAAVSAGRNLTLTASQDVVNAGVLYAGNLLALNAASFTQTSDGQVHAADHVSLDVSGALDSAGAIIGGNGLAINAGSLSSTAQLGSTAGDVSIATTLGDLSLVGTTVSAGRLDATSAAAFAQSGALSTAAATLTAATDMTLAGDVSANGAVGLNAGRDLHNTGSVYTSGTLSLQSTGNLDNRGSLASEQGLTVDAGALTQATNGALQTNGNLAVTAGSIDSKGTLASAHDVSVAAQDDVSLSGTTQAGGALGIATTGAVNNAGKLLASTSLAVTAANISNTGALSTDGTLDLHATDALDNQGTAYAGRKITLGANGLTQGASAELTGADDIAIDVVGAVNNAGKIVAAKSLDVKGGSVSSTGTLGTQQGDLDLQARRGDLVLGGTVVSAAALNGSASGAIRQSGQLSANALGLHADGDLNAQGDISALTASLTSGATLTQNGTLSANTITLDGAAVSNGGKTLSSGDLTVHGGTVDASGVLAAGVKADGTLDSVGDLRVSADGALTAHGSLLAGHMLDTRANALDLSYGTQRAGTDATFVARAGNIDHTAGDLAVGGALTAQASGTLLNRGVDGRAARMQANTLLLSAASIDNGHGQLLQTGNAAWALTTGTLDNTGGTIATNGNDLTVHGTRVVNRGGGIQLAGTGLLDVKADQDIDNTQGTLAGNGATRVTATTNLLNDGGLINAHGATTIAAASLSNTANGAISGSALGVTVGNGVNNAGGLLQATAGDLTLSAAGLSNAGGTIQSAPAAVTLGVNGTLDNATGTIAAGTLAKLTAAQVNNAGTVTAGQLSVQATNTIANVGGRLQSRGALDLRGTNGINNNAGSIEANGATTLTSASVSNVGGRIANASGVSTQVTSGGGIDNRGGTLGGQGDVTLSGTSISNAQGGTLVAAGSMTLGTGQLDNSNGTVYAGNTFNFVNAGASAINAGGKITAGQQLNLTLASLNNSGGTVQAGIDGVGGVGNVMLDIRSLVGQGTIVANNTLGMHLVGDYVQAAGSSIKASGGFSLAVDGQFVNNGSIQAVNGLTISAANITNNAGALLNSANTQLNTGGTITNAGSIQGNTVGMTAGAVNNTGTIMGGNVTIQAGSVVNGADFGQATGNAAYQSGTIAATGSVDIYTSYLLNRDAQIFSLGNINVAGARRNGQGLFDTRAGQIDNISGSIQAQGSILLAANQINNVRRVLNTTDHVLTAEESAASQPLPVSDYKHSVNKVQEYETYTEYHTIQETVVNAASAQSQILAGGNISLYGSVTNSTSTIAANGFLAVNQQGAGGGTGMVLGNENVANQSLAAGRTIQQVAVTHHIRCGWDPSLCDPEDEKEYYTYRPNTDPSTYLHDNYTALGAVMTGSGGVAISGVNVSNGGVTPDGRSVGNTRLDPNAQAIGLASLNKGSAQGAAGLPVGAQVDPATGHAPQVLGGAGQPLAGVTLPTGGIYSVRGASGSDSVAVDGPSAGGQITAASAGERTAVGNVGADQLSALAGGVSARNVGLMGNAYLTALLGHPPSGNYLIETNSRFVDYSQFISSDYLLDKLGVDPARTMMRLGDGFYEQQLVTQQVTQLTGRTYLSDYSSGLQEYQSLMNNATHVAQAMNLSVGVALTAEQVSALTQDMVWMVQQNVDGHEVLVPVVYLANGTLALTAQGAVIAGKDVSIEASGTLSNGGLIRGENSTLLTAQDLLNSGRISSGGLTAISATGNVTNLNGRIDGAGVSVIAGGDIRSENVGGLIGRGMDGASITATQGLQISAGHNLSLDHTAVTAGGDALLTAGHDLSLAGQGVSAGGSLALAAGHDLSIASSVTTTHPYAWSNTLTGTTANGLTLSAGKDLSLVAGNDMTLSATTLKAGGNAALQAGNDLTLGAVQSGTRWSTQTTAGAIDAGGSLSLQAGHDLAVQAGTLKAGGDMALLAGHDLSLTATSNGTSTKVTHDVTTLDAGGNLAVAAGNNALLEGTQIKAGGTAALQAGNDLDLTTVTDSTTKTASWKEGKKRVTETTTDETVRGVTIDAGTGVQIAAGHDATLDATTVATKTGDITLAAGHDLTLGAEDETHTVVTDTKKKKSGLFSSKTTTTHDTSEQTLAVGTSLSGDNIHMVAGNDLTAMGATVQATGGIAVAAGHDVNLLATTDTYNETHDKTVKKSGFTLNRGGGIVQAGKKTVTNDDTAQHVANGTLLSGDSISVAAGHDVLGEGAKIAGTHDVVVAAGNNLTLTTAVDIYDDSHSKTVTKTGYSKSGMNELYGQAKDSRSDSSHQVTHTGSVVGSTDGQVTLTAGGDLHLTGTDVISKTSTTIVGKNVTIDAGLDTLDTTQSQKHSEGGITGGLGGAAYEFAMGARDSVRQASSSDDDRLKALYAVKAAYQVHDALAATGNFGSVTDAQSAAGAAGINIQVGIGGSSASSKTTTHDSTSYGGHITSGGNVTIGATGGDLTIIGGEVTGKNVALAATNDINLLSQSEEHSLKNDSKNSAGSIGVSFGSDGFGIYASASVGSGKAHGNGSTHAETTINADDKLTIVSGHDTTIEGAQLKGNQVAADIGNNLTIRSEQDTDDYASKTMQAGGKLMVGITQSGFVSGSAYYAASKIDSHYTSVNEVSGIKAGDGGFQIDVGGTTHLVGGQIASAADASKNVLSTGDLVWEDLHNESKYNASQVSFSGGSTMSSNVAGAIGAAISMATPHKGNSSSDTHSGIAEGTIIVRNDPGKELSSLDRNPTLDDEALKNSYDPKKVSEQQELATQAGYVGMRTVGAIAEYMQYNATTDEQRAAWADGSRNKVILHGVVGAAMASLGGGNALQGALGAGGAEAASKAMQDYLATTDATPEEKKTYMELGAAAIGGAIGGSRGAAAALDGELNNRQLHPDETAWIKQHATDFARQECGGCDPSQEQVETATARLGQQASKDVDFIWKSVLGSGDDSAAQAYLASTDATFMNDLGKQQTMFTAERGQFFAPAQNAPDADLDFIGKYVRPGATRDLTTGMAQESEKFASTIGGAIKDDPFGVGKNVVIGLGSAIGGVFAHPIDTYYGLKDGFVSGAQNMGEGAAVSFNQSLQDRMQLIYGQDVSGAIQTVTALQVTAALGNAVGAGKIVGAGVKVAGKAVEATAEKVAVSLEKEAAKSAVDDASKILASTGDVAPSAEASGSIGATKGALKGEPEVPPKNASLDQVRAITRQNEAAELLADSGFDVEQLPNTRKSVSPDLKINGIEADVASPTTSSPYSVRLTIQNKVERQADTVVINLADSPLVPEDIQKVVESNPVEGLKRVYVIKNGKITVIEGS